MGPKLWAGQIFVNKWFIVAIVLVLAYLVWRRWKGYEQLGDTH